MSSIKKVPTDDLVRDYYDSRTEIAMCTLTLRAIENGTTNADKREVAARIRKSDLYMREIAAELDRRGELGRVLT